MTDRDRILLVGLADGTLTGRRRARAERRVRELPGAARLLERQRRVRTLLAPARPAPAAAPRRAPFAAPVVALAALLLALVLLLRPGEDPALVAEAAALAHRPATAPAPASDGGTLRASVDGVAFPDWNPEHGWRAAGARHDTLGGRAATTVFYEHMGHRLAYTILPGEPVPPPKDATVVHRNGMKIALIGGNVAVFERDGRTCVLAGHVLRTSTLIKLAASE